jgi:hypothetical protein
MAKPSSWTGSFVSPVIAESKIIAVKQGLGIDSKNLDAAVAGLPQNDNLSSLLGLSLEKI